MRAAFYERNGPADEVLVVGDVETPRPGPGEVRVKLAVSGVNPSDVKSRSGLARKIAFARVIPHSDGAGEIDVVGEGVVASRKGERVWIWNGQWKRANGTCAEHIVLPEKQAVPLPERASFETGACLGIPALTAWQALDLVGDLKGKTLLIPGGAGSVGHYAIQLAKIGGATVITTVSSAAKAKLARGAGADHVIDYKTERVGERVQDITGKSGADAVIEVDLSANASLLPQVLRSKGTIVVYGTGPEARLPASFLLVNSIALRFMLVYELAADKRERAIAELTRLVAQNRLVHSVVQAYALDEIIAAHQAVEQGAMGKVLVKLP